MVYIVIEDDQIKRFLIQVIQNQKIIGSGEYLTSFNGPLQGAFEIIPDYFLFGDNQDTRLIVHAPVSTFCSALVMQAYELSAGPGVAVKTTGNP